MIVRQRILLLLTVLFALVMGSAMLLVYSQHQSRKLFVELEQSLREIDEINTEWSQLQLEQSAWAEYGRIERKAREALKMKRPSSNEIVFVRVQ